MQVTVKLLKQLKACPNQIELFSKLYPHGVSYNTQRGLQRVVNKASKQGLNVRWFIKKMKLSCDYKTWCNNILLEKGHYKKGKQDGNWKIYDVKGKLKLEENYKENRLNGVHRKYYKTGGLRYEVHYKNDTLNGKFKGYYRNGQLRYSLTYKNNIPSGVYSTYYKDGRLRCKKYYKNRGFLCK